ncbi:MAG: type I glutamate--ammonia ligase [Melioribacteraceae bacterium]|nr:type I glutamate--ammonia ligase [Melioribacteraceae bacterium]
MSKEMIQKTNQLIKKHNIEVIDLKATDLVGRLQHLSLPVGKGIVERLVKEGVGFDGSSYGFRKVENSDMVMIPDLKTAVIDPFREAVTLSFYCNIHLTDQQRTIFSQDGRNIVLKAEQLLKKVTGADKAMWGPEFEFYIFSKVEYDTRTASSYYQVQHEEEFYNRAYHATNPFDLYDDFRDEACKILNNLGIDVKYHHHEVGERGQQEIETYFNDTLSTSDNIITVKYILFNLAREKGLFITFMPKPMYQQAGNGMHLHMFLTKNGKNVFYKKGVYGNINDIGKYFIGGLLRHGPSLSAFTNPSTNSYKRLVPGFEAPVALTFGQGNRASAIRIPKYVSNPKETRFEYRPPDATANPYLATSAMLLAGIDGIVNKINPEVEGYGPNDKNIDEYTKDDIKFLPKNLGEALDALETDNEYLKVNDIFNDELLNQWIKIKDEEIKSIATMPHPFEYKMYFTL